MSLCSLVLLALFALASCGGTGGKYETVKNDPTQTKIYTLGNGLKVYMSVNKATPRLQTAIAVRVGSKNDPSETTGLAHYFEHLMFKGTESFGTQNYEAEKPLLDAIEHEFEVYRTLTDPAERMAQYAKIDSLSYEASKLFIPNEYDKLMACIGADGSNAFTSQDMTVYVEDIPSNQIDNWARVQADRFKHAIIRGFHTELETVYEEKNMSLTSDSRKVYEAMDASLFPHHPYGTQTVLGSQEHLKNPSITNIKNYYNKWYVPNNVAICVAGDFDPDEMVATIEKYFGDWQPNPNIEQQRLKIVPEEPIVEPIVKDVYGLEAENLTLGWRFPGDNGINNLDTLELLSSVLYNGKTGVIDVNITMEQKAMGAYADAGTQPDYSTFVMGGIPKEGQTLEELRDLLLEQLENVKKGNFDDSLIVGTVRNTKVQLMKSLDNNNFRVGLMYRAFIYGKPWSNVTGELERLPKITKQDIVAYANRHFSNNYVQINKRMGKDESVKKIEKPKITPILTNRDTSSAFLAEVQQSAKSVKPIEPVFVDFNKDMEVFTLDNGIRVLYKQNTNNELFDFKILALEGSLENKYLEMAFNYFDYLGTDSLSQIEMDKMQYDYATYFRPMVWSHKAGVVLSGLNESFEPVLKLALDKIKNVKADENILENLKINTVKQLNDNKLNQNACFNCLRDYVAYGPVNPSIFSPSPSEVKSFTSDFLLSQIKDLFGKEQMMMYYGPLTKEQFKEVINREYKVNTPLAKTERKDYPFIRTNEAEVLVAPYDAKQIYMLGFSNTGEKYDLGKLPVVELYNAYFGGGMNAIVFQELREARGLAYSASALYAVPTNINRDYYMMTFIATQNDKLHDATTAFDDIVNNMPESQKAFDIAKEQIVSQLRTKRVDKTAVFSEFLAAEELNLNDTPDKVLFEKVQNLTLRDVVKFQQETIKDRKYHIGILGDKNDLDLKSLDPQKYGKVTYLTLKDIFGY